MPSSRQAGDNPARRGDVVILPFPYSERLAEKRRPGLVITGNELDEPYGLVWVMMITSAKNAGWPSDLPIRDLARAGLPAPSVVRPAKIACIERSRIIRRAGRLNDTEMRAVSRALKTFLELT